VKVKPLLTASYLAIVMFGGAAAAVAATSYEGSDYSYDEYHLTSGSDMVTCDRESDGRHVYAEYQIGTGERSSVTDGNGANNSCALRGRYASGIIEHRTCEAIDFYPDACGSRVYP